MVVLNTSNVNIIDPKVKKDSFEFTISSPFPSFVYLLQHLNKSIKHLKQTNKKLKKLDVRKNDTIYQLSQGKDYTEKIVLNPPFIIDEQNYSVETLKIEDRGMYQIYLFSKGEVKIN